MARQYTGPSSAVGAIDIYFPIGTVLELVFYVGLLKVCEGHKGKKKAILIFSTNSLP